MKSQRKYNVVPCLIWSLITAVLGALVISGLFVPLTVYLLDLLPSGNWGIPPQVFAVGCQGLLLGVPAVLFVVWFVRRRKRAGETKSQQLEKRARLDALMGKDDPED